jgi:hypothetical protein
MAGKRAAAIVGFTEWQPAKRWTTPMFALDAMAQLTAEVLGDAGVDKERVDGMAMSRIAESPTFGPSAVAEYLGLQTSFNEVVDLGGSSPAEMV